TTRHSGRGNAPPFASPVSLGPRPAARHGRCTLEEPRRNSVAPSSRRAIALALSFSPLVVACTTHGGASSASSPSPSASGSTGKTTPPSTVPSPTPSPSPSPSPTPAWPPARSSTNDDENPRAPGSALAQPWASLAPFPVAATEIALED